MVPATRWLDAGMILRAHGLRGELRVSLDWEMDPEMLLRLPLRLKPRVGTPRPVQLLGLRSLHGRQGLARLAGCNDRDEAQALQGARLQLQAEDVPPPEPGSYYLYELQGARVCDSAGTTLGSVRTIYDNGGQDLLVIDTPDGERLLPRVPELVRAYCRASHSLEVHVPAALWDEAAPPA